MEIAGISNRSSQAQTPKKDNQTLDKDDFLKLLITQMKHQDPLNPMEDREFIAQTAQFSTLEQIQNLNKNFETGIENLLMSQYEMLLSFNSWQSTFSALNLVGKEVSGKDVSGEDVLGIVERVKFTDEGPLALVNGREMLINDIIEISNPRSLDNEPDNNAGEENE